MTLEILEKYASEYSLVLDKSHLSGFSLYLDILTEWNSRMNLTGISERARIITELLLDSLIPVPYMPKTGNMIDIGSGAGFPGLMIKVVRPDISIKLVEANGKKVSFLKNVIRVLQLKGISAVNDRIEVLSEAFKKEGINIISSRAMTDLNTLIDICAPILSPGGLFIGFLGSGWEADLKKSQSNLDSNRMTVDKTIPYRLPGKSGERAVVFLKKDSLI